MKTVFRSIENLFLWSSGASLEVLNQVPSEKSKYFGIGGTVLFTALMATLAGGYAFFTAFQDVKLAACFGIFWGCLIFNLDRYIVSSFGVGDGKRTISLQELKEGAPRIVMAIILGIVISTPLEMKLFEKEITAKLKETNAQKQSLSTTLITSDTLLNSLRSQRANVIARDSDREKLKTEKGARWQQANQVMNDELYFGKTSGKAGKGPTFYNLQSEANAAKKDYETAVSADELQDNLDKLKIASLDSAIAKRDKELDGIVQPVVDAQSKNDGFLARFKAFSDLSKDGKGDSWIHPIDLVKWLISALFILIEIAPILFKMLTERGPYDDIMDRIKHEVKVKQMELQSNLNQEINIAVKLHTAKYEEKLNTELASNKDILAAVAKAQQEIALIAIEKWKEEQKEKMKKTDLHNMVN